LSYRAAFAVVQSRKRRPELTHIAAPVGIAARLGVVASPVAALVPLIALGAMDPQLSKRAHLLLTRTGRAAT
jgi:L-serine deaminase